MKAPIALLIAATALSACSAGGGSLHADPRGDHLFKVSCAGCHGADARGNGPVAPFLTVPVPDLTRIAARRGGSFPTGEIYRIVDGQAELNAHGPRHMPVWGYEFFGAEADDEAAHRQASLKVESLVKYLGSIQRRD